MKSYKEFCLNEKFVNMLTAPEKRKHADHIWAILQDAYATIGGYKGASNVDELVRDSHLWKGVRINGKIVAIAVYKKKNGRKRVAIGTDGSPDAKKGVKEIMIEDLTRAWVETSGASERFLMKVGGKDRMIPNSRAAQLTGKEILNLNPDGFHYTRMIGGHRHEKVIVGIPK